MAPVQADRWNYPVAESVNHQDLAQLREDRQREREMLRTSPFEIVSSLLLAAILFTAAFVALTFLMWLTQTENSSVRPVPPIEYGQLGNSVSEADGNEFESPSSGEIESLQEPTLQDTLSQVSEAVSTVAVSADETAFDASAKGKGNGEPGDRTAGPAMDESNVVPRHLRWQLEFSAKDISDYAKQLDTFGIELAELTAVKRFITNLSTKPSIRTATSEEPRIYFMFTQPSPLQKFEVELLQTAGIDVHGKEFAKFIPAELESRLAQIEFDYAQAHGGHDVEEIVLTIFESKRVGKNYDFHVIKQRYRALYPNPM